MITVKYFGAIAEQTKSNEEELSFSNRLLSDLLAALKQKHQLTDLTFTVAVNQKIVQNSAEYSLKSNDIVALLPPFAGG
ncbi:MoaD/ThiS family protein [Flavobacterium sp.]|uniref:MoaD/ThiS family protein n=1 Tax=Flavobacterium sp. TaxID=239 RepID=UPI0038FCD8EC